MWLCDRDKELLIQHGELRKYRRIFSLVYYMGPKHRPTKRASSLQLISPTPSTSPLACVGPCLLGDVNHWMVEIVNRCWGLRGHTLTFVRANHNKKSFKFTKKITHIDDMMIHNLIKYFVQNSNSFVRYKNNKFQARKLSTRFVRNLLFLYLTNKFEFG